MSLSIRRVVTGHDEQGRAVVLSDVAAPVISRRTGVSACDLWSTPALPPEVTRHEPAVVRFEAPQQSVFRIVEYAPGAAPRMHRTATLDYAIVLSGEIDMQLDEGEIHLRAGDVVIQRGTIHNWVNRGTGPCLIAYVLLDAAPLIVGGTALGPIG